MDTLRDKQLLEKLWKNKKIMVNLKLFKNVYKGKKGFNNWPHRFKGTWLCLWLLLLGSEVAGFSNKKKTKPSLFEILNLKNKIKSYEGDISNISQIKKNN